MISQLVIAEGRARLVLRECGCNAQTAGKLQMLDQQL
jgi:hypothetical protein